MSRMCPRNLLQVPTRGAKNLAQRSTLNNVFNRPWNANGLHIPRWTSFSTRPLIFDLTTNFVVLIHSLARRSKSEYRGLDMMWITSWKSLPLRPVDFFIKRQHWLGISLPSSPQSWNMGSTSAQNIATKAKSNTAFKIQGNILSFSLFLVKLLLAEINVDTIALTPKQKTNATWNTSSQPVISVIALNTLAVGEKW